MNYTRDRNLLVNVFFSFYYAVLVFFWVDHRLLSQLRPIFFNYNRDLTELALIGAGIPRWLMAHPALFAALDVLAFLLPFALLVSRRSKGRFVVPVGILFSLFFIFYLLLADIFWQVDLQPFMLYVLLSFAFCTNRTDRFYGVLRLSRYYFLYVFASAALWKIARGAVFNPAEMSNILLIHHSDVLSQPRPSLLHGVYIYLIDHAALSWSLYAGATLMELAFIAGFFTRRYDRWLLGFAIFFVAADHLLMRIPYWTILMGGVTLYIGAAPRKRRGLFIYETGHHENLPGLLDLAADRYEQVSVYLDELSFTHLVGSHDPRLRWPKTKFITLPAGQPKRPFIRRLFADLRRQRCSHLHLSTLDNNLLLFALRLCLVPGVHVSMTVHAVNDYFSYRLTGIKAVTESVAKLLLHRRIKHYSFFLPRMAENFRRRMTGATVVVIPSRFYSHHCQPARTSDSPLRIVIPGSISPHRRDYEGVTRFLSAYLPGRMAARRRGIELVVLGDSGTPYGAEIIRGLNVLETPGGFRVVSYEGYVSAAEYEQQYTTADVIWSPLKKAKTAQDRLDEVYGQTIASGLTADLQLGCTPVMAPGWLELPDPFAAALLPYDSDLALTALLDRLTDDRDWLLQVRSAIDVAFSADLQKERYGKNFDLLTGLSDDAA